MQEAACLLGGGFKGDRRVHVLWLLAGVMGDTWQSWVIIYRFLEERGEDQRRIVNHISKELSKIKTPAFLFSLLLPQLRVSITF